MKDIAIFGAGGLGSEVACLLKHINKVQPTWNLIGFFDDGVPVGTECRYGKVIGGIDVLNQWDRELSVVIAIGSVRALTSVVERVVNPLISFPNIIAPNVLFFDEEAFTIGKGNLITFGCRFSCEVSIGDFNILNGKVSFGHGVIIGNYNVMMPETRLSGCVKVGDRNFFGSRTFVAQNLVIDNETRMGAGCILLRNARSGNLYMGNPAKKIKI